MSQYPILAEYCESQNQRITKCTQLHDLNGLKKRVHNLIGTLIIWLEQTQETEKYRYAALYRDRILALKSQFHDDDYIVQLRLSFIMEYVAYGLDLYAHASVAKTTKETKKYLLFSE